MSELTRTLDKLLFGDVESVFGTMPTIAAINAVDALSSDRKSAAEKKTRIVNRAYRGSAPYRRIKKTQTITWQSLLLNAATGGNTPGPLSPFLRGCGLTESLLTSPTPRCRYTPTQGGPDSSCGFHYLRRDPDDLSKMLRWVAPGGLGTAKLKLAIDEDATIDFDFLCGHSLPTSVAEPTSDLSLYATDSAEITVVTSDLFLDSEELAGVSIELDLGYTRKVRHSTKFRKSQQTGRETTGSIIVYDQGLVGDLYALADSDLRVPLLWTTDDGAGKRGRLACIIQLEEPEETDLDDSAGNSIAFTCVKETSSSADFVLDLY